MLNDAQFDEVVGVAVRLKTQYRKVLREAADINHDATLTRHIDELGLLVNKMERLLSYLATEPFPEGPFSGSPQ